MFFSVLTFTFSTGAQATKLLKSFFNSNVAVVIREDHLSLIVNSDFKNVVTIARDACVRWDVLPELFNHRELGAHIFTIDRLDNVVSAVQAMNKTNAITIAFTRNCNSITHDEHVASVLLTSIKISHPKMVFNRDSENENEMVFIGDDNRFVPVNAHLAVQEYQFEGGQYIGMFSAKRKIPKNLLTHGICNLRFYVDGEVHSYIDREPEIERAEPILFDKTIPHRTLSTLIAQCTIEKDAVANMKLIPGYIVAEISCSSSFISSILIPIEEDVASFLNMAIGYLNDIKINRQNIAIEATGSTDYMPYQRFESYDKLKEDLEQISKISRTLAAHLYHIYKMYHALQKKIVRQPAMIADATSTAEEDY